MVYETINLINGKKYIGVHKIPNGYDYYLGSGVLLTKAIKKYGKNSFKRKTLLIISSLLEAHYYERKLITSEIIKSPDYYNIARGGYGGNIGSGSANPFYGKKHSSETRKRMSKIQRNKEFTIEGMNNLREAGRARVGYKHSDKSKEKMRMAQLGNKASLKTKEKLRISHLGANSRSRVIICVETGDEYVTSVEAAVCVGIKAPHNIRLVCQGIRKTAGGYHWRYKDGIC